MNSTMARHDWPTKEKRVKLLTNCLSSLYSWSFRNQKNVKHILIFMITHLTSWCVLGGCKPPSWFETVFWRRIDPELVSCRACPSVRSWLHDPACFGVFRLNKYSTLEESPTSESSLFWHLSFGIPAANGGAILSLASSCCNIPFCARHRYISDVTEKQCMPDPASLCKNLKHVFPSIMTWVKEKTTWTASCVMSIIESLDDEVDYL